MEVGKFVPMSRGKAVAKDVFCARWRLVLIAKELYPFFNVKGTSNG